MVRKLIHAGICILILLGLSLGESYAHMPPGYSLKVKTHVGDYTLKVMVYPGIPEVNKTSEIIVGLINSNTNTPYRGRVKINGIPATEFSPGFYEINYIFNEVGNASVRVEFAHGGVPVGKIITVEVQKTSAPYWLFLVGTLIMISLALISAGYLKKKKTDKFP